MFQLSGIYFGVQCKMEVCIFVILIFFLPQWLIFLITITLIDYGLDMRGLPKVPANAEVKPLDHESCDLINLS